jgi:DNA helicase-2/ATP-dependent DNA helicase PcrA
MLERWLVQSPFGAKYLIVDEAQDLSALQWRVIQRLAEGAEHVWVAGDDDQCIHEWNGASRQHFQLLESDTYTVLPQSYRLPKQVHRRSEQVILRVTDRLKKAFQPREEEGAVVHLNDLLDLEPNEGTWLMLARNQVFLLRYIHLCHQQGLLYESTEWDGRLHNILDAIQTWQKISAGHKVTAAHARILYQFMGVRDRIAYGFKQELNIVKNEVELGFEDLVRDYGLLAPAGMPWATALNRLPEEDSIYLQAVDRKGNLLGKPRIRISTIHGAKGKEADNVIVAPDMTTKTWDAYQRMPDNEHRVFYVAMTRAKKRLYLLHPTSPSAYQW